MCNTTFQKAWLEMEEDRIESLGATRFKPFIFSRWKRHEHAQNTGRLRTENMEEMEQERASTVGTDRLLDVMARR